MNRYMKILYSNTNNYGTMDIFTNEILKKNSPLDKNLFSTKINTFHVILFKSQKSTNFNKWQ